MGQSKPSIQGVWRAVEVTITNPKPAADLLPTGTHTNIQPGVVIFTAKHFAGIIDIAGKPRPTFRVRTKPTAQEMQSIWGPFNAGAGTYELSGTSVTVRFIVAKDPEFQRKGLLRFTTKLDGNNLWMTLVESFQTEVTNPVTVKYVRIE